MKSIVLNFIIPFCIGCTVPGAKGEVQAMAQRSDTAGVEGAYDYPLGIKQLDLEKFYDKTKWVLYCIHSDQRSPLFRVVLSRLM